MKNILQPDALYAAGNWPLPCCEAVTHQAPFSPKGNTLSPQSWCLDIYVTTLSAQNPMWLTQPVENRDSLGWNQTSDNSQRGSDFDSHSKHTRIHMHTQSSDQKFDKSRLITSSLRTRLVCDCIYSTEDLYQLDCISVKVRILSLRHLQYCRKPLGVPAPPITSNACV